MYNTKTQPLFSGWVFAFLACSKACNFGELNHHLPYTSKMMNPSTEYSIKPRFASYLLQCCASYKQDLKR